MVTISTTKKQEPNSESAVEFLRDLRPNGRWTLAAIDPNVTGAIPVVATFKGPAEVGAMLEWIEERNGNVNLYFMPNPTKRRMRKKPFESDIARFDFAHAECDPIDGESAADARERHRAKLKSGVVPAPTLLWSTGNGMAALWCIERPVKLTDAASIALCKATNKGLAEALGGKAEGVDNVQNLDRLLRLPHTSNIPDARKLAKGRKIELAGDVEHNPARVYSEFDLPAAAAAAPSIVTDDPAEIGAPEYVEDLDELPISERVKEIIREGRIEGETKAKDDSRSAWEFEAICGLLRDGVSADVTLGILLNHQWPIGERVRERPDPERYARKEIERARRRITASLNEDFGEPVDTKAGDDSMSDGESKLNRFKAMLLSQVFSLPEPEWLVDGILEAGSLFQLYGRPKCGKTFWVVDAALSIATGRDFHGYRTKQGRVLYVIGEGNTRAFGRRIQAWTKAGGGKKLQALAEASFYVLPVPVHCDVKEKVAAFLKANPGPWALCVMDTLMRNFTGSINDQKDITAFVEGCDTIRQSKGNPCVLVVHHEGKDKSKGGMGNTNMDAAIDGQGHVERKGDERIFTLTLARNAPDDFAPMHFVLESVPLTVSMDPDKEDVRSAVLKLIRRGKRPKPREMNTLDRTLIAIYQHEPKEQQDLAMVLGVAKQTISDRLSTLRGKGFLSKKGLSLTADGRKEAELLLAAAEV